MKASVWLSAVGAGIVLAAACTSGNGYSPDESSDPAELATSQRSDSSLESLLLSLNNLQGQSRPALAEEMQRVEAEFNLRGDPHSRLALAWLLSRPGSGFQDERRAVGLLREYYGDPNADSAFAAFARLLHDLLLARAVQQAASSRAKAALAAEREQAETLREQIATLQQVLETLQQQFEALKDIETSLSARPSPETELLSNDGDTQDPIGR